MMNLLHYYFYYLLQKDICDIGQWCRVRNISAARLCEVNQNRIMVPDMQFLIPKSELRWVRKPINQEGLVDESPLLNFASLRKTELLPIGFQFNTLECFFLC